MKAVFSHITGLQLLARYAELGRALPPPAGVTGFSAPNRRDLDLIRESHPFLEGPHHFLSSDQGGRRYLEGVVNHVVRASLPRGSLRPIGDGLYVISPELCFVQMASMLDLIDTVRLGFALLGTYGLCEWGFNDGVLQMPKPFTTREKLSDYIGRCPRIDGIQRARRALPMLLADSASPAETQFGMTMTLPRRLGGQAIHELELNREIPLPRKVQRIAGKGFYRVDLYDSSTAIGFEYLGEESHGGMIRGVADLRRESILQSLDVQVHGVTKQQARNLAELMRFARIVCRARGVQYRNPTPKQIQVMQGLVNRLYSGKRHA